MATKAADLYKHGQTLDRTLSKRLDELGGDKEIVEEFVNDSRAKGISPARIIKYLYTLIPLKRLLKKDFKDTNEDDIKKLAIAIEQSGKSDATKSDYRSILKLFLRHLEREPVWLKIGSGKHSRRLPEEVLSEEDVKAIATTAYSCRDRAFVLGLYESGCRIGEFLPLKLKHINFDKNGAILRVDGKTGPRRIRLVFSVVSIQKWFEDHPAKGNPEAFLWCKLPILNNPKWINNHLSYGFVLRLLKGLAKKAGVKKKANAHSFRHARATFLASHLKEPQMREFFGWERRSDSPSTYIHLSGRDVDDSILSIYGKYESVKTQEPILKVDDCPRCKEPNDPVAMFCQKCGLPFKEEAVKVENKLEGVVVELLKVVAETNPTIKDRFREIVKEKGMEELFS
jgi:integrase